MSKIGTPPEEIGVSGAPEQLCLLSSATSVPLQFRLSERTRLAGLAHVAALRAQLAEQAAVRSGAAPETRGGRQIAA